MSRRKKVSTMARLVMYRIGQRLVAASQPGDGLTLWQAVRELRSGRARRLYFGQREVIPRGGWGSRVIAVDGKDVQLSQMAAYGKVWRVENE